jgi:DNA-binding winged helix-turn-helix (wHTH) protein/Tfp pilus assembly protein PilF
MSIYEFGPFHLSAEQLLLSYEGDPVALGPKVVETLLALVEHPGVVLGKSALVDRIWPEGFVEEANLAQNIHVLRKTFRRYGCADPVETVPRRGYRFTAPVRCLADLPPPRATAVAVQEQHTPPRAIAAHPIARRIAAAIAGAAFVAASLLAVVSYSSGHRATASAALSVEGARLYSIGRYYWNLRTRDGVRKSLTYFAHVVDTDPRNARGYAALADANLAMGDYCYGTHDPPVYFARAHEYAKKALALDPNSAEAHAALGLVALGRGDANAALPELRRAVALDDSYAPAQEWYGIALIRRGRVAEGVTHLKTALRLDPLSVATIAWLGAAAYQEGRFDEAIAYSRQALELSPRRTDVLMTMGQAYEAQGDPDRAIEAFERYGAIGRYYRPEAAALLAHAYALAHRPLEARAELAFARAHARDVDPTDLAAAATAVGDRSGGAVGRSPEQRAHRAAMYA